MKTGEFVHEVECYRYLLNLGLDIKEQRILNSQAVERNKKAMETIKHSEYGYKGEE